MKIKWIGKYDGNNLPTVDVGAGAKELPEVTSKSAIILIPIVLLFVCCVYIKKTYLGGVAFSRVDWMIGLVIALLFFPVHELIHAVSFPAGSEVIMFYTTQGLGTTCTSLMTRNRFIVVNMLPSLILGIVPLSRPSLPTAITIKRSSSSTTTAARSPSKMVKARLSFTSIRATMM